MCAPWGFAHWLWNMFRDCSPVCSKYAYKKFVCTYMHLCTERPCKKREREIKRARDMCIYKYQYVHIQIHLHIHRHLQMYTYVDKSCVYIYILCTYVVPKMIPNIVFEPTFFMDTTAAPSGIEPLGSSGPLATVQGRPRGRFRDSRSRVSLQAGSKQSVRPWSQTLTEYMIFSVTIATRLNISTILIILCCRLCRVSTTHHSSQSHYVK